MLKSVNTEIFMNKDSPLDLLKRQKEMVLDHLLKLDLIDKCLNGFTVHLFRIGQVVEYREGRAEIKDIESGYLYIEIIENKEKRWARPEELHIMPNNK